MYREGQANPQIKEKKLPNEAPLIKRVHSVQAEDDMLERNSDTDANRQREHEENAAKQEIHCRPRPVCDLTAPIELLLRGFIC